ncbi:MAG: NUDIX domain-containing protein [Nitrospirota bacterium]|nr:NUDIX domain-containing protein [Nitrospirota bacterium]
MEQAQEQFDVLDRAGKRTGRMIKRDEAHASGAWHGAFHCLITYHREGRLCALFQLRSRDKKIAAGKFDVSVGGHYAAGEGPETAGPREISEELGLAVPFSALVSLGKRVFVYGFQPGVQECEFQDVFLLPLDGPLSHLSLQKEEVDGVLEMDVEKGIRLFCAEIPSLEAALTRSNGAQERVFVRSEDFVPSLDNYYLKLLQLAKRYSRGEQAVLLI